MIKKTMFMLLAVAMVASSVQAAEVRLTAQQSLKSGLTPTRTTTGLSTANTYKFRNDGKTFLLLEKTGAGDCTVTFTMPNTVYGLTITAPTVSVVATTGDKVIGPFPAIYADANSDVTFTLSDTVGLSLSTIRL